jgi:D-alanine-D-alanine ligase
MKIGITYDLKEDYLAQGYYSEDQAEFDQIVTIEAIDHSLQDLGFETDRIGHIKNLAFRLVNGDRWDLVFNIAEGLRGFGREAQVPCLLDAYGIPYTFSDPLILSLTLHKGMAKRLIRDMGIPTPAFFVIESEKDIQKVHLPSPLFAKPIAEGSGKGISAASKIHNADELKSVCSWLLNRFHQPVLVETFLPGREFTVGIVGSGKDATSVGVLEIFLKKNAEKDAYTLYNKDNYCKMVKYRLAKDSTAERAKQMALTTWRGLGCRDAGRIDLRTDDKGLPHVIELNPLAGLHPVHSDLPILCKMSNIPYKKLIEMIIQSTMKRLDQHQTHISTSYGIFEGSGQDSPTKVVLH